MNFSRDDLKSRLDETEVITDEYPKDYFKTSQLLRRGEKRVDWIFRRIDEGLTPTLYLVREDDGMDELLRKANQADDPLIWCRFLTNCRGEFVEDSIEVDAAGVLLPEKSLELEMLLGGILDEIEVLPLDDVNLLSLPAHIAVIVGVISLLVVVAASWGFLFG
ncbi:hypothetical protein QAD02_009902 [Eretmocerus hayati]|uniref:Uncharacterized protein n=1 Tax=Eretmocerus hayati TaxID=131215 RepID=A0ACC2ND14_9HYME|nr:hypothetical protein QAD02_009902 [Eretmocerus hayati]